MSIFGDLIIPDELYPYPLTLSRYNKMITHYIQRYLSNLDNKERISNHGNNLYSQNSNNESE